MDFDKKLCSKKNCITCKFTPGWDYDFQWIETKCKMINMKKERLKVLYYFSGTFNNLPFPVVVFKSIENFDTDVPMELENCRMWEMI